MELAAFIVVGGLMGHLLDLFLDRFYSDEAVIRPLYRCASCRAAPSAVHLLPVVGYLWHRGRCEGCGVALPWRALLLPAGGVVMFVLAFLGVEGTGAGLLSGFFATVFLALAFTDVERRLIPNRIVYPSLLLAAAFSWAWPDRSIASVFAGGAVALGLMLTVYILGRGALGFGDVKMEMLLGMATGLGAAIVGLFLGAIAAGAVVAILLVARVLQRRDYIPYGPFIAIGAIVAIPWGGPIVDWYVD